ncbi:general secretion pathway protein C, partial [Pseudomonas aeruginosa]
MPAMPRIDPPRLVQFAAVLAILAGLLFWGYLLLAPIPGVVQADVADVPPPSGEDAAQRWFAAPSGEVEVQLAGLISGGPAAIAILSVNGAPAPAHPEGAVLDRTAKVRGVRGATVRARRARW